MTNSSLSVMQNILLQIHLFPLSSLCSSFLYHPLLPPLLPLLPAHLQEEEKGGAADSARGVHGATVLSAGAHQPGAAGGERRTRLALLIRWLKLSVLRLLSFLFVQELSNIDDLYGKLKASFSSEGQRADASINLVRRDLVPQLRSTVVDFYKWQHRNVRLVKLIICFNDFQGASGLLHHVFCCVSSERG